MKKRDFLKTTFLASVTFFVPDVIYSFNRNILDDKSIKKVGKEQFFIESNSKFFKYNFDGSRYILSKVGLQLNKISTYLKREYYISDDINGYGTPSLLKNYNNSHFVFVPELYLEHKINGYIITVDNYGKTIEKNIFKHENQGYYAFWGKEYLGNPTLYHYNFETHFLMRAHIENDIWINHQVMPLIPTEMISIYQKQFKNVDNDNLHNQFGYDFKIHKDDFYQFLTLKSNWEQVTINKIKNDFELQNIPEISPNIRKIKNPQFCKNNCGCASTSNDELLNEDKIDTTLIINSGKQFIYNNEKYIYLKLGFENKNIEYTEINNNLITKVDTDIINEYPIFYYDKDTNNFEACYISYKKLDNQIQRNLYYSYSSDKKKINTILLVSEIKGGYNLSFGRNSKKNNCRIIYYIDNINNNVINTIDIENKNQSVFSLNSINANFDDYKSAIKHEPRIYNNVPKLEIEQKKTIEITVKNGTGYTNPFVVIYCEGDDTSHAPIKVETFYKVVSGSEIIIPNMPAYKTQNEMGECRAFALATLLQKYTCDKWKNDIPDCKNPPADSAISYFGVMAYTNRSIEQPGTLQPNQTNAKSMYEIINDLSKSGNQLILESCKPFDILVNSFSTSGQLGIDKYNKFMDYLKKMYNDKKSVAEASIADCLECLAEINKNAGLNTDLINLKKALTKDSFDKFLFTLFFNGCKMENFPAGFRPQAYPINSIDATPEDIKKKAVEGLRKGKPVMFPSLCVSRDDGNSCSGSHAIVVSGYKKVCEPNRKSTCKELFKVHNSWGAEWQKIYNDGWVDSEAFTNNLVRLGSNNRIASCSVMWLEP